MGFAIPGTHRDGSVSGTYLPARVTAPRGRQDGCNDGNNNFHWLQVLERRPAMDRNAYPFPVTMRMDKLDLPLPILSQAGVSPRERKLHKSSLTSLKNENMAMSHRITSPA